ncbi:MAG: 3'-5' exonuclease domain-containing protein 2 [Deltaproteobacteria bacterium]|jgi:ribonuclease D|nr:3'-5' exonuclease domain-containing protein 2 [Deltaproteobacteria bacterium]
MQNTAIPSLSKEEINTLPIYRYDGKIVQVDDADKLRVAIERLRQEKVLGFDTETKPSFRKGTSHQPALIQLACSDVVFLFLLRKLPLGPELAAVLADPSLIKAGVAIRDDMNFLRALYHFEPGGAVDLGDLARKKGLQSYGLRPLAACLLRARISKNARCSNWNNSELTEQQINYAATDAWISREIYLSMQELE